MKEVCFVIIKVLHAVADLDILPLASNHTFCKRTFTVSTYYADKRIYLCGGGRLEPEYRTPTVKVKENFIQFSVYMTETQLSYSTSGQFNNKQQETSITLYTNISNICCRPIPIYNSTNITETHISDGIVTMRHFLHSKSNCTFTFNLMTVQLTQLPDLQVGLKNVADCRQFTVYTNVQRYTVHLCNVQPTLAKQLLLLRF